MALIKCASDEKQLKITSFLDRVVHLVNQNTHLFNQTIGPESDEWSKHTGVSPLLQRLYANAVNSASRMPQQRRHETVLKKFLTSLFIYAGPMTYDFVHRNMPDAIPSLRTLQRIVHNEYVPVREGEFRFDNLLTHLTAYKAPMAITIGEDATQVIARVESMGLCVAGAHRTIFVLYRRHLEKMSMDFGNGT